jgi:hypothetical protein
MNWDTALDNMIWVKKIRVSRAIALVVEFKVCVTPIAFLLRPKKQTFRHPRFFGLTLCPDNFEFLYPYGNPFYRFFETQLFETIGAVFMV